VLLFPVLVSSLHRHSRADQAAAIVIARGIEALRKLITRRLSENTQRAGKRGRNLSQALYNMGVSYYELWRTAEAIDSYRLAIRRGWSLSRASYALGVSLEITTFAEAKEAYRQSYLSRV